MQKVLCLVIAATLLTISACSGDDDHTEDIVHMKVNHYRSTGFALSPVLTYLVQQEDKTDTDTWDNFYSSIEGFDYEPGYIYMIYM